jgi:hypothetical protein
MKMRISAAVLIVALLVGGLIFWLHHRAGPQGAAQATVVRSVPELEELVYRTPFDVDLELELARASWQKFESSMKTDGDAGSECVTSYMIAAIESGSRKDIIEEFRTRFDEIASVASLPGGSFDQLLKTYPDLYHAGVKPNIQHILSVRDAIEPAFEQIHADDRGLEDLLAAQEATERYLRNVFNVEIGKVHVRTPEGNDFYFTPAYFKKWEDGLRSYGLIVAAHSKLSVQGFIVDGSLSAPPDAGTPQIGSGDSYGRFSLPEDREVIPGLHYFQDAAANGEHAGFAMPQGELADGPTVNSPVGAYRRFLELRELELWSQAFDLLDEYSQHQMVAGIREALQSEVTDPADLQGMNAMSDREIWIGFGFTGHLHPTAIVGVETHGDNAVVRTRVRVGGASADQDISMIRSNGAWKMVWKQPGAKKD